MGRDRAAYMREYRARRKRIKELAEIDEETGEEVLAKVVNMADTRGRIDAAFDIIKADMRIAELEEEVRHLKAELAKRPSGIPLATGGNRYSTRPFTPVPKK